MQSCHRTCDEREVNGGCFFFRRRSISDRLIIQVSFRHRYVGSVSYHRNRWMFFFVVFFVSFVCLVLRRFVVALVRASGDRRSRNDSWAIQCLRRILKRRNATNPNRDTATPSAWHPWDEKQKPKYKIWTFAIIVMYKTWAGTASWWWWWWWWLWWWWWWWWVWFGCVRHAESEHAQDSEKDATNKFEEATISFFAVAWFGLHKGRGRIPVTMEETKIKKKRSPRTAGGANWRWWLAGDVRYCGYRIVQLHFHPVPLGSGSSETRWSNAPPT